MKSVRVCLVVRVMSGGSAEQEESVVSIRRIWNDEADRYESSNQRAPLLSRFVHFEFDAGGPSHRLEPHRPRVN